MQNRNPIMESWRLRRSGTGGGGGHKSRNAPRGGQRNVQADYLAEYLDEVKAISSETENQQINDEEDGMTLINDLPPRRTGFGRFVIYEVWLKPALTGNYFSFNIVTV